MNFFSYKRVHEVRFTAEELAAYLSTQSNVIAATEQGPEAVEQVYQRIATQTRPFFPAGGFVWYLQKIS